MMFAVFICNSIQIKHILYVTKMKEKKEKEGKKIFQEIFFYNDITEKPKLKHLSYT